MTTLATPETTTTTLRSLQTTVRIAATNPETGRRVSIMWSVTAFPEIRPDDYVECSMYDIDNSESLAYWRSPDHVPGWVPRPDLDAIIATLRYLRGDFA